ncbi:hypothetical protein ACFXG4_46430 [Nocardia sp. NPDC059246]|uniref:hypothetical protein n=1 Tax=unclassified Nocardia TaxID=2637762 RepID=UPI00369FCCCF
MIAIGNELHDRYPELLPVLTGLDGGAGLVQADIRIRRQLLDADIYSRTADFTTIPDRIRRRWRATTDDLLPAAYLRYQCAAIDTACNAPSTSAQPCEIRRPAAQRYSPPSPVWPDCCVGSMDAIAGERR